MKMMENNLKSLAIALALVIGGALPAFSQDEVQDMFSQGEGTEDKDLLSIIKEEENLSTFAELLEKSGLDKTLEELEGPLTILTPTNDAFEQLTKEKYNEITNPDNKAILNSILQSHVLPRKIYITEFEGNQVIESSVGEDIPVETAGVAAGGPMSVVIGGSTVVRPDVEASNGIIHVVDRLIIPGETGGPAVGPGVGP